MNKLICSIAVLVALGLSSFACADEVRPAPSSNVVTRTHMKRVRPGSNVPRHHHRDRRVSVETNRVAQAVQPAG